VHTPLCDLVGIEVPVVLAPMGGAVTPELAAAVSNAGALGILPLSWTSPEEIGSVVEATRQQTGRPFGVNLGLAWDQRERLGAALEAGVRIVSFFWGDASGVIGDARDAGALVFVTVGTAEEGRAAAPPAPMSSWHRGGRPVGTFGERSRRWRSSPVSSMRWRRCRSLPPVGSPTVAVSPLCSRSARRARG
jgi:nitronate monooxygenase